MKQRVGSVGHLWHLREAAASEREKSWFAAAFHLEKCIEQEKAYTAVEGVAYEQ